MTLLPWQARSGPARPTGARGIGDHDAMMVRPDHVITWRTTHAAPNPTAALAEATRRPLRLHQVAV
ncbi:hypothetical protein GCM10010211_61680 [Streptomyces albospinus]|uniref:Monooxygenase n=2 Tax=Streptomyces albospinus TaxID=285515 RepID=A0ABQ2VK15_9ACTN|nr:hypothetical protein [Streptomyces albospinus]GGU87142.1 hypothetical protein GCM10010211_61680 [Streptomyces albospinus]